jgi:hypothetical protein
MKTDEGPGCLTVLEEFMLVTLKDEGATSSICLLSGAARDLSVPH